MRAAPTQRENLAERRIARAAGGQAIVLQKSLRSVSVLDS